MKALRTLAIGGLMAASITLRATTYWVDSVNGNDSNDGMSGPSAAWKSMATADGRWGTAQYPLAPGDHIELANGSTWYWPVELTGVSGASGNNILVENYVPANGSTTPPLIYAQGLWCGVQLWNCSFITVQGLRVNGYNTAADGVYIYATNYISSGILVNNMAVINTANQGDGVYVQPVTGAMVNDLTVQNCNFTNVNYGVQVDPPWGGAWWPYGFSKGATNIVVNNINVIQHGGNDGLYVHNCQYVTFENSVVLGAEASWMEASEYYLAHNIWGENANASTDGTGIHIDYDNAYVTIEDCYFKNNSGGFVEILTNNWNCCFRYNLSFNDGSRIKGQNGATQNGKSLWIGRGCHNIYIYNNMITVSNFISNFSFGEPYGKGDSGVLFQNNVFHYAGGTQIDPAEGSIALTNGMNNCLFSNNNYIANNPAYLIPDLVNDSNDQFCDPQLNIYGNATAAQLQNAGVQVLAVPGDNGVAGGPAGVYTGFGNPTVDIWGHATDLSAPNIGGVQ